MARLKYGLPLLSIAFLVWDCEAMLSSQSRTIVVFGRATRANNQNANHYFSPLGSKPSNVDETPSTNQNAGCPFSMKYPRYRVPVSSGKDTSNYSAKGGGMFAGIKISLDKAAVERKYAIDVKGNNFFWIEPNIELSDDSERTAKGKIGVFTSSVIWRKVADMIDAGGPDRAVISIPNASAVGLLQLSDIINWYQEQQDEQTVKAGIVKIEADVDEEAAVPTVILKATRGEGESCAKKDQTAEHVISGTKSWVNRVLVKLGICPFTKAVNKSGQGLGDVGVPVGNIAYHHSSAGVNEIPHLMADTWEAIFEMIDAGPSGKQGISSILLAAPEYDENFPLWAGPVFAMLEANVGAASAEPLIGVVCFHPRYKSPNGQSWPGFGHMHSVPRLRKWLSGQNEELSNKLDDAEVAAGGSYQRRTPYATINVLRAEQLEAAEGMRSTADLYATNIGILHEYGFNQLEEEIARDKAYL